jgi:hypothetical protein
LGRREKDGMGLEFSVSDIRVYKVKYGLGLGLPLAGFRRLEEMIADNECFLPPISL